MSIRQLRSRKQHGMTIIGILLLLVVLGFMALVAMKVVPMYIQLYTVKSTIESIRKEPQLAQMTPAEIHDAIQKRFDIGYVDKIRARDLKIANTPEGRVLNLVYENEQPLFYGLYAVLKVDEVVPLTPK